MRRESSLPTEYPFSGNLADDISISRIWCRDLPAESIHTLSALSTTIRVNEDFSPTSNALNTLTCLFHAVVGKGRNRLRLSSTIPDQ